MKASPEPFAPTNCLWRAAGALLALLAPACGSPHHSIGGEFVNGEEITVEGSVEEFRLINPHTYIVLAVTPDEGDPEIWTLTYGPATKLIRGLGWSAETLRPGDRVTATGRPAREGHGLYLSWLARDDGTVLLTELVE